MTVGDPAAFNNSSGRPQRHIAIFRPFAQAHVQELAGTVDIRHLQLDTFRQAQATGVNGTQADPVVRPSQRARILQKALPTWWAGGE